MAWRNSVGRLGRDEAAGNRRADDFVREAYWIVLARAASPEELSASQAHRRDGGDALVLRHLLSSPEFGLIFSGWRDDIGIGKDPAAHEAGLKTVGDDGHFVHRAYQMLLGRDADPGGHGNYVQALGAGEARRNVVRTLVTSDEFETRYRPLASREGGGFVPRDVQLCELANPAKWDNPEWIRLLKSLQLPHHKLAMHRKSYEWTQLLFALDRLGAIRDDATVLSVGAGHECVLYWLANHVGSVVATDAYEGRWQGEGAQEGDARVVERPEDFAPFPYRRDRLKFQRMDGRTLEFPDASFDIVYSLSSIEHFGGFEGARAAMLEMARVLKPGGVLLVATEYVLAGGPHEEAFSPEGTRALFDLPGCPLVEPIDEGVWRRYDHRPVDLRRDINQRPHMVVQIDGTTFTSVFGVCRKH